MYETVIFALGTQDNCREMATAHDFYLFFHTKVRPRLKARKAERVAGEFYPPSSFDAETGWIGICGRKLNYIVSSADWGSVQGDMSRKYGAFSAFARFQVRFSPIEKKLVSHRGGSQNCPCAQAAQAQTDHAAHSPAGLCRRPVSDGRGRGRRGALLVRSAGTRHFSARRPDCLEKPRQDDPRAKIRDSIDKSFDAVLAGCAESRPGREKT